ncbi:FUSC family protein [Anaerococcus sp. AGMB00486]|uniref:FUSC family protein n=2 Tax=Anaerococcus TaxID=165779 RepID=A0ABX2N9V8_9FIRM|nr:MULTISPECIES: FUSC family protein [Anaerococcus]MDY3006133.1 FUSC family protein [Anaerococcus porci]MSS77621.1 FUSC family protein [Anaerococcus porci]NVF11475.1 FUSC family protein [Anaerococcus faecalis]
MKLKRPGQRILKTSLAVFLSFVFSHFRSSYALPFYSAIAAIICTKSDFNDSIIVGVNRIFGTLIGGICGFLYLLFVKNRLNSELINYFFISIIIAFLIWFMSSINKPNAISIMAIVFCSISINHAGESFGAIEFALNRTLDTLVGVVIAIFINSIDFELRKFMIFKKNKDSKDL